MLHVIIDAFCPEPNRLTSQFYSAHNWQMNLMMAVNQSQGVAQMLALELGLPKAQWLIASPIHWEATHNDAMITLDFQDSSDEIANIAFLTFKNFLAKESCLVYQYTPSLWLFDTTGMPELKTPYLGDVMHRSFLGTVLDMPSVWKRWMTEMQMLFVKSDFSKDPSINGIWPWGAGVFELNVPLYQLAGDSWPLYLDKLSIWNENKTEMDAVLLVSGAQANTFLVEKWLSRHQAYEYVG